jgi:hypothetical protein
MPLHETLTTIINDYPKATNELFAAHPFAAFIRQEAAKTVEAALGELGAGLLVEGSAGAETGQLFLGSQYLIPRSRPVLPTAITWSTCST